jgi:hypothetical protein
LLILFPPKDTKSLFQGGNEEKGKTREISFACLISLERCVGALSRTKRRQKENI